MGFDSLIIILHRAESEPAAVCERETLSSELAGLKNLKSARTCRGLMISARPLCVVETFGVALGESPR